MAATGRGAVWAGGCAGVLAWASIYPIDVAKTQYQTRPGLASARAALRTTLRDEGGSAMLRGLGATLLRAAPQHAVTFTTYEALREAMDDDDDGSVQ